MSEAATMRRAVLNPWAAILLFILLVGAVIAAGPYLRGLAQPHVTLNGTRDVAAFRATFSVIFDWAMFAGMLLILRLRGQRLADLGWGKRAAIWGWIGAVVVVALYGWGAFAAPIRPGVTMIDSAKWLSDWSAFRIVTALAIGITSGICEEAMFRGFVMTQARDGGAHVIVQVLLAAVLFGGAHIGWGGLSGQFNAMAAFGAAFQTTILGLFFAIVYVLGRRSLMPVIAGHAVLNFILEPWMMMFAISGGFVAQGAH